MASVAAAPEQSPLPELVKVKLVCSHCDRVFIRHSRRGYTARCPHCGTVNAGPALLAEQGKPKAEGARRRSRRRTARAEEPPGTSAPAPTAAAPVRRKRTATAPAAQPRPGSEATGEGGSPRGRPASEPVPPRRGLFDRLMGYGHDEGDDDG